MLVHPSISGCCPGGAGLVHCKQVTSCERERERGTGVVSEMNFLVMAKWCELRLIVDVRLIDVRALAIQTTSVVGGDREIPAWLLPGPHPTISTGRSMTNTGGTQTCTFCAAGPHCREAGENWFVLTLAAPITLFVVINLCDGG